MMNILLPKWSARDDSAVSNLRAKFPYLYEDEEFLAKSVNFG